MPAAPAPSLADRLPADRRPALPIWAAPMAGGPSTPELVAAVGAAGGLGFLAAGYLPADAVEEAIARLTAAWTGPWGINLFVPTPRQGAPDAIAAYAQRLAPLAERHGVALGEPRWDDDGFAAKLDVVRAHRPAVVSLTFGVPVPEVIAGVRDATGAAVVATVTSVADAVRAEAAGVDALCVQGHEAGGHRSLFADDPADPEGGPALPLRTLLADVAAATPLPLVAAGGIMTGAGVRGALRAGAQAVQLGTAFLTTPEAGTSALHRRCLLEGRFAGTVVTRAFTGRPARALANVLAREGQDAPAAYPELHHLTRPLRAAATRAGDADVAHLWAGTGWAAVTDEPAGALVRRLAHEAGLTPGG
ncbi:nitronate monooxygenase [Patulibacter sp. SYSU D01012]|uniref:NAD(P)H-dependent flavin oxidoreductase n=1 Tax=Patulibacter sp. SYSU D01012 TaxID=2817381 RepID=UPI001B3158E5|nr:nitronate monooxygenase [Patulibacter sp. SYSU D01012]